MTRQLENEFKFLVDADTFHYVLEEYDCIDKVRQTNYYFDTKDFILTQDNITLRCREIEGVIYLQFKIKQSGSSMYVSSIEMSKKINFLPMHIKNSFLIKQFDNVPKKYNGLLFEKIGLLVTERYSIIIKGIVIYLDKNYYNGQIDYEIEIEFTTNTLPYAIDVIDTLQLKDKKSNYGKKKRLLRSINYRTRERKEN